MKYRVLAIRGAGSVCGPAKRYCSCDGKELEFDTQTQASNYAYNLRSATTSPNLDYQAEPIDGRDNSIEGLTNYNPLNPGYRSPSDRRKD